MEEKIFCQNCGSENVGGSRFCLMCGCELKATPAPTPIPTEKQPEENPAENAPVAPEETPAETNAADEAPAIVYDAVNAPEEIPTTMFEEFPAPAPQPEAIPPVEKKQKKEKKPVNATPAPTQKPKRHIAAKIFAALFGLILLVVGLLPTVLYPVHQMLNEDNIRHAIEEADIYEIIEDLLDGEDVGDFIVDSVHVKMQGKLDPSKKQIKKLLADEDIKEFLADKLVDYATDILEDNGDGEITSREIYKFVKDNRDAISEAIGYELTDTELNLLKEQLDKDGVDKYSLSIVREENTKIFEYVSYAVSDLALYLSCGVVLLFAIIIFLICLKCVPVALKTVGIVFFINGGIALLVKPAYAIVMKIFDDDLGKFTSLIEAIGKPFFDGMLFVGFVFVCAGAAMIFINIVISLVTKIVNNVKAKRAAR